MSVRLSPVSRFGGKPLIPGDKSVSHRSLIFGALSRGETRVRGLLESGDVHSTWGCLRSMGVPIERQGAEVVVQGVGLHGLKAPTEILDCGNSGTTMRLLMGVLAGQSFRSELTGDGSLRRRPMKRVAEPLSRMGARITLTGGNLAPLQMEGCSPLRPIDYELPVASAQLKSALLLAGLYAQGTTRLSGMIQSRDHTERLLPHFGVRLSSFGKELSIAGGQELSGTEVEVPRDLSTAAFWMGAALIVPGASVEMQGISLNPTRTGILKVLERMGARIETELTTREPETMGTIRVFGSRLQGTRIEPEEIPELIDELPLLAVIASQADGELEVHGAEELRFKESDRIEAVAQNLRAMGGEIETYPDGFRVRGRVTLRGARIDSLEDHRIAMAFSIASLVAQGTTEIDGTECVGISYPGFFETLRELSDA